MAVDSSVMHDDMIDDLIADSLIATETAAQLLPVPVPLLLIPDGGIGGACNAVVCGYVNASSTICVIVASSSAVPPDESK